MSEEAVCTPEVTAWMATTPRLRTPPTMEGRGRLDCRKKTRRTRGVGDRGYCSGGYGEGHHQTRRTVPEEDKARIRVADLTQI